MHTETLLHRVLKLDALLLTFLCTKERHLKKKSKKNVVTAIIVSNYYYYFSLFQGSYDTEVQALHELFHREVITLLSDPENIIKQTLLENGITQLCAFFGRQKA